MSDILVSDSATNPSMGDTVVTTGTLTAGHYQVAVATAPTGTIASGDLGNVQLQVGDTVIGPLLMAATADVLWPNMPVRVNVPLSGAVIQVTAIGDASGSSATYNAQMAVSLLALFE